VPDAEISLFTDGSGAWAKAILVESPESMAWQRTWIWIRLPDSANQQVALLTLWNADCTRGLLVPLGNRRGKFNLSVTFRGNIGAEAPGITQGGNSLAEPVLVGAIPMVQSTSDFGVRSKVSDTAITETSDVMRPRRAAVPPENLDGNVCFGMSPLQNLVRTDSLAFSNAGLFSDAGL
jgi:hypothetical protein